MATSLLIKNVIFLERKEKKELTREKSSPSPGRLGRWRSPVSDEGPAVLLRHPVTLAVVTSNPFSGLLGTENMTLPVRG